MCIVVVVIVAVIVVGIVVGNVICHSASGWTGGDFQFRKLNASRSQIAAFRVLHCTGLSEAQIKTIGKDEN